MIREYGDAALLVEVATPAEAQALAAAIDAAAPQGVLACVPGMDTVLVEVDPLTVDTNALSRELERLASRPAHAPASRGRHRSIPVVYGAEYGPDLADVARAVGLSADEVVRAHGARSLSVAMCGFAPGFAYLDGLDHALRVPRLATPRTSTPAGSVAIAGSQCGIYPAQLPGGWRVIGRTPVTLFDPTRDVPSYLAPGDTVAFRAIEPTAWDSLLGPPPDW